MSKKIKIEQTKLKQLIDKYGDLPIKELKFLDANNFEKRPTCPICNNFLKFYFGYKKTCSRKCDNAFRKQNGVLEKQLEKYKQTNIKKYGVDNPSKLKQVIEKRNQTKRKKYGSGWSDKQRQAILKSKAKAYLTRKQNLLDEFGVENISQLDIVKQKRKQTFLERYGVEHYHQSDFYKNLIKQRKLDEIKIKVEDGKLPIIINDLVDDQRYKTLSINFVCNDCGELRQTPLVTFSHRLKFFNNVCKCQIGNSSSFGEKELVSNIKDFYKGKIETNVRILDGFEIDIFIPEYSLGIEYNGLYWHSENGGKKDKWYHYQKTKIAREKNIRLLHVFENEFENKRTIVLEKIKNLLNLSEKVAGARKINIVDNISYKDASDFLNSHHIQGQCHGTRAIGGYYNDKLVSVLSYKWVDNNAIEIVRYANDFKIYPGLFSKFLSYLKFEKNINRVETFADLRYSYGDLYTKTGFMEEKQIPPDYYYTDYVDTFHKFSFRKQLLKNKYDLNLNVEDITETEMALNLGYDRIWDSGKIKYSLMM